MDVAYYDEPRSPLPDTHKGSNGERTVSNGRRKLPDHYVMRDILGMEYMD